MVEDNTWWLWLAAGVVIAIFEVAFPGYIFVGFALGSIATGLLLWSGLAPGWMVDSTVNALMVFAVLSLLSWLLLRFTLGVRKGQSKTFDRDINEE